MPELPEVEVVRQGLSSHVVGRVVATVQVLHPRAVRRHPAGADDFADTLAGLTITGAHRRGKYLWLPVSAGGRASGPYQQAGAILAHLGMSGQFLLSSPGGELSPHTRVRFAFADGGPELRFTDQRTFGHLMFQRGDAHVPPLIAHIAPDPLERAFDETVVIARFRARRSPIKAALLDQSLISGVGNIYADEALWRARMHWARPARSLSRRETVTLLAAVREVLREALLAGGTSFDSLYVDVNGESGYFGRSLNAYGRAGLPCRRCGAAIRREPFMNRSAYTCPVCQPRAGGAAPGRPDLRRCST